MFSEHISTLFKSSCFLFLLDYSFPQVPPSSTRSLHTGLDTCPVSAGTSLATTECQPSHCSLPHRPTLVPVLTSHGCPGSSQENAAPCSCTAPTHTPPPPALEGSLDRTAFHKYSPVHAEGMSQIARLTSQDEVMLIKMFSKKDCNHCTNCPLPKGQPATGVSTGSSAIASTVRWSQVRPKQTLGLCVRAHTNVFIYDQWIKQPQLNIS